MKAKIGGREVELNIDDRLKSGRPLPVKSQRVAPSGASAAASAPSPYTPYKNKLEKAFAQQLDAEWRAGAIKGWLYEPFSFRLSEGKRYRVDFVTWGDEGIVCWECKGYHANVRDSLTHLKWAAQRFPFFKWRKVIREKGRFQHVDIVV
jgi:hypothetical protein